MICLTVVLLALVLSIHSSECTNFIEGLNDVLEQFETCNIRITALLGTIVFEPFSIPVTLLDENRLKYSRDPRKAHNVPFNSATHLFAFKYRKILCSVSVNLIFHLGKERYEALIKDWNSWYQLREYMNDKYLVII